MQTNSTTTTPAPLNCPWRRQWPGKWKKPKGNSKQVRSTSSGNTTPFTQNSTIIILITFPCISGSPRYLLIYILIFKRIICSGKKLICVTLNERVRKINLYLAQSQISINICHMKEGKTYYHFYNNRRKI